MPKRTNQNSQNTGTQPKKKRVLKSGVINVITILLFALALYILICLIFPKSGISGVVGKFIFDTLLGGFGAAAYIIPVAMMIHALRNKSDIRSGKVKYKWIFSTLIVVLTGILIHAITYAGRLKDDAFLWKELVENGRNFLGGGGVSGWLGQTFVNLIGPAGTIIFTIVLLLVSLFVFLGITPSAVAERFQFYVKRQSEKRIEMQHNSQIKKEARERRRAEIEEDEIRNQIQKSYANSYSSLNSNLTSNKRNIPTDNFYDIPMDDEEEVEEEEVEVNSYERYPGKMPSDDTAKTNKTQTSKFLFSNSNIQNSYDNQTKKSDYSDYLTKNKIITSYVTPATKDKDKDKKEDKVEIKKEKEEVNKEKLEEVFDEPENKEICDKFVSSEPQKKDESYYNEAPETKAEINIETQENDFPEFGYNDPDEPEVVEIKPKQKRETKIEKPIILAEPESKNSNEEKPYVYPKIELLAKPERKQAAGTLEDEVQLNADKLVEVLEDFNIQTHVVGISKGPKVTRYDVELERGVRVRSLLNCVDDISYALATNGVRITGVVPGKSAIGIEVPNKTANTVYMREMIDTEEFRNLKTPVSVSLGVNVPGEKIYMDISKMPHLLVAGTTGSGKSVLLHTFIISMLYRARPDEVKFIMIDPKRVEFNLYKGLPHLVVPIISEPKKAAGALHWATQEMDRRFELIENESVRDFKSYNEAVKNDPTKEKLASLIIIIDEFADLMMQAPDEVEKSICRIAQKARAAGIHLVIGTQRPTVNVVTGLIKANIPSRISLMVANANESRIIIDETGANNLLGQGDMLYKPVGASSPERIQGAWVSDKEIESVVKYIIKNNSVEEGYDNNITEQIERAAELCDKKAAKAGAVQAGDDVESTRDSDPLLKDAIEIAVKEKKISASLLQRRLSLGFSRASKLIDIMEARNIVSAPDGQKPRNVLITEAEYAEMLMRQDSSENEEE